MILWVLPGKIYMRQLTGRRNDAVRSARGSSWPGSHQRNQQHRQLNPLTQVIKLSHGCLAKAEPIQLAGHLKL